MGARLVIASGYEALVERLGLRDPRRVPDAPPGDLVNAGRSRGVHRIEHDGHEWYLKVYRYPWHRPRRLLTFTYRRSRARNEYESLAYLRERGLPAVEPVAYGSHRVGPIIRSCFLLTRGAEGIAGDEFLEEFFARPRTDGWRELRRRMIADVADIVHRMHAADLFYYDLKFRNILVHERAGALDFRLLDFPKGEVISMNRAAARRAALIRDLATLDKHAPRWFSKVVRLRWYVRYLARPLDDSSRREVRHIEALREHMLAKRR